MFGIASLSFDEHSVGRLDRSLAHDAGVSFTGLSGTKLDRHAVDRGGDRRWPTGERAHDDTAIPAGATTLGRKMAQSTMKR